MKYLLLVTFIILLLTTIFLSATILTTVEKAKPTAEPIQNEPTKSSGKVGLFIEDSKSNITNPNGTN